jgi:hypothetical protein
MKDLPKVADDPVPDDRSPSQIDAAHDRAARAAVEAALAREYRFQNQLGRALADDGPEQGLADALHDHLGLDVVIEDAVGHPLAHAGTHDPTRGPRSTGLERERLIDAARRVAGPLRLRGRLASVSASRGTVLGVIIVHDPHGTLEPADKKDPDADSRPGSTRAGALHAIALATGALTLHLLHRRHLAQTELRLRHDLVEAVLLEPDHDDVAAELERRIGRASALEHDLTGSHRVLALRPRHGRWPDGHAVGDLVEQAARSLDMPYLGTLRGQTAILVCGTPSAWLDDRGHATAPWSCRPERTDTATSGARAAAAWQTLHDSFTEVLDDAPVLGVGGYVDDAAHLPRSYREAMQALTVRLRQTDPRGLTTFEDLGLYRLLATPEGRHAAGAYVEDWLGALLAYDADRHADLIRTLTAYLDHGGNYDDTAAALHIHRSTLRYRLQRIRELSGHDLTHPDTRLNLHVALRAAVVADPPVFPA